MSWRTPVALEGAHDTAFNIFVINVAIAHLFIIPYGIVTSFTSRFDETFAYFELAYVIFALSPLIIYHVVVLFYHIWNLSDYVYFRTTHALRRSSHCLALWHLRRTACLHAFIRTRKHDLQQAVSCGLHLVVYHVPPLSYVSNRWTLSSSRQTWISQATPQVQALDMCVTSGVCKGCQRLVRASYLLVGSSWPLTRRREMHHLGLTLDALETSASSKCCHLCTVLWFSMSNSELNGAKGLRELSLPAQGPMGVTTNAAERQPLLSSGQPGLRLAIRKQLRKNVHDESHLFMQLFMGSVSLGHEILIEDDPNSPLERELSLSTDSSLCLDLARNWLHDCQSNHPRCRARKASQRVLPSRLIFIERTSDDVGYRAHLVQTKGWGSHVDYLALSHCWGSSVNETLTDHNLDELCRQIEPAKLSQNFIDAIHITQKLGFSYLWIDSLCIMQKCFNHDASSVCNQRSLHDWETESRQMANVYAQASCTISATGSAESSGGCFKKRNPLPYFPCHILADPSSRQSLTVKAANTAFKTNMFHTEVDGGPLNTRAWAFQERLLSQRIIHFGASLIFFECSTLFASELQPEGIYDGVDVLTRDGTKHEFPDLDRWAEMLDPFLPPPQPSAPPALEPEDFTPPEDSAPSKPSVSIKLPNTYGVFPSKHERQARARYNKAWNLYRARKRHRLEENAARGRRHAARERARQESAEQAHLRKSEQALQIPRAPNPAYKAPEVVASLSDNSVTGYRGAFDFLAAAAAAGSSRDIAPRDQLRLHQRWFELVSKYTRSQLTVAGYRHMAAAGVARAIQGPGTNADYLAGLWRRHLEFDLLWSLEGSPKCRPSPYRAPSWSWISVDGAVSQRLLPFTLANEARRCEVDMLAKVVAVQVLDAKTGEEATDATAPIGTGLLELRGVLCPVSQLDVNEATGQGRLLLSGTWAECVMDTLSSEVRGYDDLFCLPVLNMTRFPLLEEESMAKMERASLHGIILRQFGGTSAVKHISSSCKAFERVGSFVLSSLLDDGLGVLEAIRHPTLAGDLASTSISVR